jgi:diguanylate cyclase (GGDEF)-like protein
MMAGLAGGQALFLVLVWPDAGPCIADLVLLGSALLIFGSGVAGHRWQQRSIARPLRRLIDPSAHTMSGEDAAAREIALLGRRLTPAAGVVERDVLTGLLTAVGIHDKGQALIRPSLDTSAPLLLLVIDIARLRDVNGLYGFGVGNELLRQFARRLTALSSGDALLARMGGDRFAVLAPIHGGTHGANTRTCAVLDALARPFHLAGCELVVVAHAGVALFPEHATGFDALMRAAELALETSRRTGTPWCVFDPMLNNAAVARKTMEKELRHALEAGELVLHYQPQVDLAAGKVLAVEALLRWNSPERGLVPPQAFIPIAEASGLIRPIGAWVLGEACRAARRWHEQGLEVGISVNVSAAQLKHQDLPATVAQALEASGLAAQWLELELTESMFVDPTQIAMHRAIQAVAVMNVRLAIDDFGTGYSSLGYLKRLPVDKIKIDKSFVRELGRDDGDAAIVRSIIGLGQSFGKRVLAEGIETAAQFRFLLAEGCHEGQGYHFARPMPEPACTEFLRRVAPITAPAALPALLAS